MCYLPPLIHQLRFGFHPPPVSSTYQSNHFLATFQCQSHFELKAKVQLWWVRNIANLRWTIGHPIAASRCADGPSGSSQCMSRLTQFVTQTQFGLVMTCARRACLLYSQRWCENDETESGWQEGGRKRAKARCHERISSQAYSELEQ